MDTPLYNQLQNMIDEIYDTCGMLPNVIQLTKDRWEKLNTELSFKSYKGKPLPETQVRQIVPTKHKTIIPIIVV